MNRRNFLSSLSAVVAGSIFASSYGKLLTQVPYAKITKSAKSSLKYIPILGTGSKVMPITLEAEANTSGYVPADGMQIWKSLSQCESYPDRLTSVQDMGQIWSSYDHGQTWLRPRRFGLLSCQGVGVEMDPLNPDRIFVRTSGSWPMNADYEGLYLSEDAGMNFSRKVSHKYLTASGTFSGITYAPSSKDFDLNKTKRWYCFFASDVADTIPVYMSDNYGTSFTLIRTISKTTYGVVNHARVHPTDQNKVYTIGGGGLYCYENADQATGAITKISGTGGLISGGIYAPPYISTDGSTMIVGVGGKGIYKSIDSGANWTQVGIESSFNKLWVNPWDTEHMILTYSVTPGYPKFSKNGGLSFSNPISMQKRPGVTSTLWVGIGSSFVAFHPTSGQAFLVGKVSSFMSANCHFRTNDFGANWIISMEGFCGAQFSTFSSPQMFSPTDKNRFAFPMVDIGVWLTSTGGRWFKPNTMTQSGLGVSEITQSGLALHPDDSKQTILSILAEGNNNTLFGSYNDGNSWTNIAKATSKGTYVCFDPSDPSYAFWGRQRSANHGIAGSWVTAGNIPSGHEIWAGSLYDPAGIGLYALSTSDYKTFYRSIDRGLTWTLVLVMPHDVRTPGAIRGLVYGHPFNRNILFTQGNPVSEIWQWDLSQGTETTRPHTVLNVFGPGGTPPVIGTPFHIKSMVLDYRHPEVMYAYTLYAGSNYCLFRTQDGGATAWENITELVPTGSVFNALEVSPLTGDLIISGGNGTYVIPPPYEQEGTLYSAINQKSYIVLGQQSIPDSVTDVEQDKEDWTVYPNPTDGLVNVDLHEVCNNIELILSDVNGKLLQKIRYNNTQFASINIVGSKGLYLLTVIADDKKSTFKIPKR